jgi:hypothetical protein
MKTKHQLPKHFFVSSADGALHDTRKPGWHAKPLRENYSLTHREIKTVADLKATLRAGPYAWPGLYPLYFITSDSAALSFESARNEFRWIAQAIQEKDTRSGWCIVGCDVNWEDAELLCDHSGKRIESAYGEDSDND